MIHILLLLLLLLIIIIEIPKLRLIYHGTYAFGAMYSFVVQIQFWDFDGFGPVARESS